MAATTDQRHTPKEGRYKSATSYETTYVIPHSPQSNEHDLIIRPKKKQLAIPQPHSFSKGRSRITPINNVHPTIGLYIQI